MSRDSALYLADIVDACRRIERFADGRTDDQVFDDEVVRDAILFNLVVIGEATASLPQEVLGRFDVVRTKVPELRRAIEPALDR